MTFPFTVRRSASGAASLALLADPHVPDLKVAELIAKASYPMARRTVAKYRRRFGLSEGRRPLQR